MKTIYIMWLRELKRYSRSKSRIVGSLGQPILFLLALGYGLGSVFQKAGQGNYINFLAPGIIGMSIIFTSIFSGIQVIYDRQFGFLKETMVAPVSRFNIMIGRTLGGATVATIQGTIVLLLALIPGFRPQNWFMIIPLIFVMLLVGTMFTASRHGDCFPARGHARLPVNYEFFGYAVVFPVRCFVPAGRPPCVFGCCYQI
jgi:ABC-2 type transport system permease protein